MGDYAAEIRVNTKIETKRASSQLLSLENRMVKAKDKITSLNNKMKELELKKAPSESYKALQTKLENANKELIRLIDRQNELESIGIRTGSVWDKINEEVAAAGIRVDDIKEKMYQLEKAGKAFTLGKDTAEYVNLSNQLKYSQKDLEALQQKHKEIMEKMGASERDFVNKSAAAFQKVSDTAINALKGVTSFTHSIFTKATNAIHKMGDMAKRVFLRMHKDTKKQNSLLTTLKSRFSGIALSLLVFNWITRGFNGVVASVKDGVKNLVRYSKEYNSVVSDMIGALSTLKNSFATAFAPIMTVALPYLTQLINFLTSAINKVAQLIAALTGKSTWTKAKKQTTDYAGSLNEVSKSAKEAYRSLAAFDELNVLNKQEEADTGAAGGINPSDMFEEVPIDSQIKEFADKIKAILSKLFEPLKKAWDRQGKKVIDAWKYALKEISALVKAIASDFLEVWNQEMTVKIFEDVLLILADIGLVIGNLAKRFREAWEANETGKKILENIRDLIGIIVKNIREAADFTVDWSDKLDFSPLLEAFEEFTKSLAGPVEFISGILTDFYTQVLLPLSKWTIEKGLPDFLDILTEFNNKIDWEGMRKRLSEFWNHLEPFAETIGEGLLIFIRDLSQKVADFTNSETFQNFLSKLEAWMDNVEPEDVAAALEKIAAALIILKTSLMAFEAVKGITTVFTTIKTFLNLFNKGGGFETVVEGMEKTAGALGKFQSSLLGFGAIAVLIEGFKVGNFNREIGSLLESMPKKEDYDNVEQYNKAVSGFRDQVEAVSHAKFDTSGIDNFISKITGKELERDENGAIKCGLTDMLNALMRKIDEAYPKLEESQQNFSVAGYNSVAGFNSGFEDATSDTEKIIDDFCDNTLKGRTEKKLEINSPSKLFEQIGIFLMQGLINGIGSMNDGLCTILNNAYDTITSILEKIKSYVTDMVDSIKAKIASITSGVSSAWSTVTSKVSSAFGRSVEAPAAYNYDMPELATGGITTGTTIAKIGEAGREAVLPLENNTEWMNILADKINGSGTITVVAELDGREIFRNVVERNKIYSDTTGKSAFVY